MSVRSTERRLPHPLEAADLGESLSAADGHALIVSYITSPLVTERDNVYVVFVIDDDLASRTESYDWTFTLADLDPENRQSDVGEVTFRPSAIGPLEVTVRLRDASDAELTSITLSQEVVEPNTELEALIAEARDKPGPGVGNVQVARELVNDHNPYYQAVTLATPESSDSFRQMIFGMVFDGALQRSAAERSERLGQLAGSLNDGGGDFATLTAEGAGVCGIRLALLAMVAGATGDSPSPAIEWTELPDVPARRAMADDELRQRLAALDADSKIDLFNIVRFPKSNIIHCARIVEVLRDRYFKGASFDDVVSGLGGTRAHWIVRHFREGPLVRV
jgi:hypothetical protein